MKPRVQRHARVAPAKVALPQQAALIGAIIIAVVLVYLPALRGDFVWDDFLLITGNPLLQNFSGLVEIWSGGRTADYFPLTNTIFWIEHHLFSANATGYHAVNILLQIANALLVWRLLTRLNIPGAWLAGLIFGIHPVHVASVAWISELKNLLAMFFALLSVLCLIDGGLPNLAIRFSPRVGMAAFDFPYLRFGGPLALAGPWDTRRFFCGCLFRGRTPSIAGSCSNGICAQRHTRRQSSPVFCGRSFARTFQRGRRIRVEPPTTHD